MQKYSFKEHFIELKNRLFQTVVFFIVCFGVSYWFSDSIYELLLSPLDNISINENRRVIYTGLAEAFFSYIKLSLFAGFFITLPFINYQLYSFIGPGLHSFEKKIALLVLAFSPILFYGATFFVFYFVMPKAWEFFLSYENNNLVIPLVMEAKISEYLELTMQLMLAFGLAFQLPVIMVIFNIIGVVTTEALKNKRRISIVLIFIIAAIFTPPDVISQIALAIPLIFLYEISIILCKIVENKKS